MNNAAAGHGLSELGEKICLASPRVFFSGVQLRTRLDSRLKRAGMTDFG